MDGHIDYNLSGAASKPNSICAAVMQQHAESPVMKITGLIQSWSPLCSCWCRIAERSSGTRTAVILPALLAYQAVALTCLHCLWRSESACEAALRYVCVVPRIREPLNSIFGRKGEWGMGNVHPRRTFPFLPKIEFESKNGPVLDIPSLPINSILNWPTPQFYP